MTTLRPIPWVVVADRPNEPLPAETVPPEGGILTPGEAHYLALIVNGRTPPLDWHGTFFDPSNPPPEVAGLVDRGMLETRPRPRSFPSESDGLSIRITDKGWVTARLLGLS